MDKQGHSHQRVVGGSQCTCWVRPFVLELSACRGRSDQGVSEVLNNSEELGLLQQLTPTSPKKGEEPCNASKRLVHSMIITRAVLTNTM